MDYNAENLDNINIDYVEYIAENLDNINIDYAEYIAENLDNTIAYAEYLAGDLDGHENEYDRNLRLSREQRELRNKKIKRLIDEENN